MPRPCKDGWMITFPAGVLALEDQFYGQCDRQI
ncbi:hypothetical protein BDFB_014361 [Asbolus verrucosus]|uniref:Uncharacterized protein n=1 Tax=Asbolus verrucosus TaxID=1661398 RepID=A0A482VC59_ASBVE|nr:hypothetical protein BDFB_014361 [Asbolus verrucosus]